MWAQWLPKYARRLAQEPNRSTLAAMASANPAYILRNWRAQEAIAAAEKGDFQGVNDILRQLASPYEDSTGGSVLRQFKPPSWAADLICTCSS